MRATRRASPVLLCAIVVLMGATLRVRYLHHEMMARWRVALEGGAATTQATVDDWFVERDGDAEALATTVAVHAGLPRGGDPDPPFTNVIAPVARRGKFLGVWVLDPLGAIIASSVADSLRDEERAAAHTAIATNRPARSAVMFLGPHAALVTTTAPVRLTARVTNGAPVPAAVVLRADVVKAFSPWAGGRPNAAMSRFSTPSPGGPVLISACPEQAIPVCLTQARHLPHDTPEAIALARRDTFGVFQSYEGDEVLALTRFDRNLQWGVIRRVRYSDAVVPLNAELTIEGAFLAVLLALAGVAAYAANRTIRIRRFSAEWEATERLSVVLDAATDGIISLNEKFAITMVNGAVERMLGYAGATLVGRPIFSLFAPEWHAPLSASLHAFALSGVQHAPLAETERCIALCADGQLMPVDARVGRALVHDVPLYVMGLRDVSERARTEMFLQGQRHVLERIASGAPAAETLEVLLSVVRREAPQLYCSVYEVDAEQQVARIVSAPGLPASVAAAVGEVSIGPASAAVGTAIHRGESVFSSDITGDPLWSGSSALLISHGIHGGWAIPLRAADGHVIGALAGYYGERREPTSRERELARAAVHLASIALSSARDSAGLRASEASFRSFVENAPAAIFRETRSGVLVSTNPAMVELLGYGDAAELSRAAESGRLYHDAAARRRLLHTLETDDVAGGVEVDWRRADGSLVTVRVSARAYRDERGVVRFWEGYAENVTSLRAAEGALRRNERLAAVGQLISGVAHELNNPLSSIMHFAEDLLSDPRSSDDAEALGVIRDQARRSRTIVRDLLSFVRQRDATAQLMSLSDVVAATLRAMGPELAATGVQLHLLDGAETGMVLADRSGLEQIVTNLVSNAAHAAGGGGQIWVTTELADDGCNLVVEDSGRGIPNDILPRIFDPFFTTKQTGEGTGLGLSVTLGIVEQFGGRISVCPRPAGPGTRFIVFLPCLYPEVSSRASVPAAGDMIPAPEAHVLAGATGPAASATGAGAAARVALIIDDEPTIRAALRRYFMRRGWSVEEAEDGRSGLALLEDHGAQIDVVISDLRMPGYSGIELHDQLASSHPALLRRFVFSTGDVASTEAASFVQRTLCPVLQKPFELRMLDEVVARVGEGVDAERVVS